MQAQAEVEARRKERVQQIAGRRQSACHGGPVAWMVHKSLAIQKLLQVFFGWVASRVIKHPNRCIWGTVIWMNLVLPAALLGRVELRNEEVLLPQDARELLAQNAIRDNFGNDWGMVSLIYSPTGGGDILTEALLTEVAQAETEMLSLKALEYDDPTVEYGFQNVCEQMFPTYADGSVGPCFFMSLFGPNTPWNPPDPTTGEYLDTAGSLARLLEMADTLEAANPNSPVDGIHLAMTQLYAITKSDAFMNGLLGTVSTDPSFSLSVPTPSGATISQPVITSVSHVYFVSFLRGVARETLTFSVWDLASFDTPSLKPPERWEKAFLTWGEENESRGSLTLWRAATSSTSTEMLNMVLWSVPLVFITLNCMIGYVVAVFLRRPLDGLFWPRLKLAVAGVTGVQLAAMTGIFFSTAVQVPLTFASQFVMFLVMGIGLDGVFLMVDTFDGAPADLTLEDRVRYTVSRAGPSIIIASLTDICAFLTAAFTPIPAITYFCVTVAFSLIIANAILFTWFAAWMYRIEKKRMAKFDGDPTSELAKVNGGSAMIETPLRVFFEGVGRQITKPSVKALIMLISLALFVSAPFLIAKVTPDYGPADFVKGCGVFCDPSYLLEYNEELENEFDDAPMVTTLMLEDFDINADYADYTQLLADLKAGPMSTANGMQHISVLDGFCEYQAVQGMSCGASAQFTSTDVEQFLVQNPLFARDVKLPPTPSTVLPCFRLYYPMTTSTDTTYNMDALRSTNEIVDKSPLAATAFGPLFTVFSMFSRIDGLLYTSLAMALGVAFLIMLLSLPVHVALLISAIVVMVDADLLAAIYWQNNNLAPFSFAAVVISVGLCLDYSIHVAQEFLTAEGSANERASEAVTKVGRAVFNGGFTTFLGMAILSMGPGKPFYAFAFLFMYMVVLGLFHGVLVLPVVMSIMKPASIAHIIDDFNQKPVDKKSLP